MIQDHIKLYKESNIKKRGGGERCSADHTSRSPALDKIGSRVVLYAGQSGE